MFIGIDLSLRSTGLVCLSETGEYIDKKLIQPNPDIYNNEELIIYIWKEIKSFIDLYKPSHIGLEGLSFSSLSSSKDIMAGNFWYIRIKIREEYPNTILKIIPVLTWRNHLFDKEERKTLKENENKAKELKKELIKLEPKEKKRKLEENQELLLKSNIKYLTWEKLPKELAEEFKKIGFNKGCYDVTDAYFITKHIYENNQ